MTVYIEYALLENFIYDGMLLSLAFFAAKQKTKWYKIVFSALLGSIFAVLYPFILLPAALSVLLKVSVGGLLCLLPFGRLKNRKEWGRYAFTVISFLIFTFGFGGALQAFSNEKSRSAWQVAIGFAVLSAVSILLVRKFYQKRALYSFIYPCAIENGDKRVELLGYYDSGNCAERSGVPVCFLSPDVLYDVFEQEITKGWGHVCDEIKISTMSGEKKIPLYRAELTVKTPRGTLRKKEVYFTPSRNMISREYKLLLNARILEG